MTSVATCSDNYSATSLPVITTIAPVSAYHHGSYAETYSRFRAGVRNCHSAVTDASGAVVSGDRDLRRISPFALMANQGQRERKGGASAHRTLHGHLAAMRGHHLLHDIESQPRASRFRGMQRLKNLGEVLRGNAAAGILHGEGHCRGLPSPLEDQGASLRHSVDRVVHQIHQDAPETVGMERDHAELVHSVESERDAMRRECREYFVGTLRHQQAQLHGGL